MMNDNKKDKIIYNDINKITEDHLNIKFNIKKSKY